MPEKKVYTLGLCTMGTSSAALFKNGKLIAAVEEERLSRKKNDNSFPNLAIKEVLKIENIKLSDVDKICVYWQPWRVGTRLLNTLKKFLIYSNTKKIIFKRVKQVFTPSVISQEGSWSDLFRIKTSSKQDAV